MKLTRPKLISWINEYPVKGLSEVIDKIKEPKSQFQELEFLLCAVNSKYQEALDEQDRLNVIKLRDLLSVLCAHGSETDF